MERYIRVGVFTLLGLLLALLLWFAVVANQDNKLSPDPAKTQSAIELDDQLTDPAHYQESTGIPVGNALLEHFVADFHQFYLIQVKPCSAVKIVLDSFFFQ
jgi:hypothetical protein